ncbi:MgtC/SapB family protein [Emticicia sp. 17c]|uniref:MgtC/SapB family protein n=1 Tax=Emticicia sp. 17c TaxID=3127704 RepID=UPI00301C202C
MIHFIPEDILKLLISAGTGAIIGFEREYHSKSAGLRTMILICLGSTLFTIISMKLGADPSRIAANIVTGIGFVGGGIIFRDNSSGRITGITTAAAAWVTAALGMCVGFGKGLYETGFVAMIMAIFALYVLVPIQTRIKKKNLIRTYRIVCKFNNDTLKHYEHKFAKFGLDAERDKQTKSNDLISGIWVVRGPEQNHEKAIKSLLNDPDIIEFDF